MIQCKCWKKSGKKYFFSNWYFCSWIFNSPHLINRSHQKCCGFLSYAKGYLIKYALVWLLQMLKCRVHVSSEVADVCQMLTQWWHWIIGAGFMVNLASWKDGDLFFPSLLNDVSYAGGLVTIFLTYSATQTWIYLNSFSSAECPKASGMGGEFQQRGQKNSANSLQMCLFLSCVGGTLCCPHWREKGLCMEKVQWIMSENNTSDPVQLVLTVWCSREEKGGIPGTHSFHSMCADSEKCRQC